jgi:hypothetical protein
VANLGRNDVDEVGHELQDDNAAVEASPDVGLRAGDERLDHIPATTEIAEIKNKINNDKNNDIRITITIKSRA